MGMEPVGAPEHPSATSSVGDSSLQASGDRFSRQRQASTPCHPARPALVRNHVNPSRIPRCNFDPQPTCADPSPGSFTMLRKFTTFFNQKTAYEMIEYALLAA